jgi:UDP-N-acetylmuramoyl-L-alanyl-D-glutamate--2,6-diaminopimelate ligase
MRTDLDRTNAIRQAIELAARDDVIVVSGKGHERTLQIGGRTVSFSDVEAVRSASGWLPPGVRA